mmetsp:Transcript_21294/g.57331  ORF Transcript_21294/g.57331 Transcript_21294/m.57331 type:complete len:246 (+) Transcript_21294:317-1054(+)
MEQCDEHATPARADRVADGDRAAARVHGRRAVEPELLEHAEALRSERLVRFDQLDIRERPARLLEALLHRGHRPHAHDRRVDARACVGHYPAEHRRAERGGGLLGGDDDRGRAIVDARGVARGDGSVFFERRAQLAELLGGRARLGILVGSDDERLALLLRDAHRRDLGLEPAVGDRRLRTLLRGRRKVILLLAGEAVLVGDVLGGDTHVVVVERAPEAVVDHRVLERPVAHPCAVARGRQDVRR